VSYRTDIDNRERSGAIVAVVAIHAALVLVFLHLSGTVNIPGVDAVTRMVDLAQDPPPPPPPPPQLQEKTKPRPKEESGGSPPNLKSEATPIKAIKPKVVTPPLPTIAASETPRQGTAPTQGASNIPGTGTGTGGSGNGTGNGNGNGSGGGGDGGVAVAPRLASPVLSGRDFPRDFLDQWPGRATVFMRLKVDQRGFVAECSVDRGTGVPAIDNTLCNLAHDRLRFRPALNRSGQAVAGWFGYAQPAPR
jgi:protein TonB